MIAVYEEEVITIILPEADPSIDEDVDGEVVDETNNFQDVAGVLEVEIAETLLSSGDERDSAGDEPQANTLVQ